jgi:macrolide-specific efflux system membrane fusion protein
VLRDDGAIEERVVQVGAMNRVSAQIVSGLEAGEKVVAGTRTTVRAGAADTSQPKMQPRL